MSDAIRAAGVDLHNEEPIRMDGVPPMCSFADGNGLVYLEDESGLMDRDGA